MQLCFLLVKPLLITEGAKHFQGETSTSRGPGYLLKMLKKNPRKTLVAHTL